MKHVWWQRGEAKTRISEENQAEREKRTDDHSSRAPGGRAQENRGVIRTWTLSPSKPN